jgi:PAS domain S-box-containing protein
VDLNRLFPAHSQVGALLRAKDWSTTVFEEPGTWPLSLQSIVSLVLNSKFPMFIAWGRGLGFLYNDAYLDILGNKHPQALGARFQDSWGEVWADIEPILDSALAGQSSYFEDLPFTIQRAGQPEEAWFTFSYSPLQDDEGTIAGMYCTVVETTRIVRNQRLQEFQLRLADRLHHLALPDEIVSNAVEMLAEHLSAAGCWYTEIDDTEGVFHVKSGWFTADIPPLPASGKIDDFSPALLPTLRRGLEFVCEDVVADPRTRDFADLFLALKIQSILIVPIIKNGTFVFSINAIKSHPYLWTPQDVQAAKEVANRTWVAMENAVTQQRLHLERDRSNQILNQMGEGFMLVGEDGRVTEVNAAGLRILGRSAAEVVGKRDDDLWGAGAKNRVSRVYQQAFEQGEAALFELNLNAGEAHESWLEIRISPLHTGSLAVFFRDVTAQKRAAVVLRQSQEHLTSLFEQTAAGIAERDLQGRLIRVNQRFCKILGRTREELLGLDIHDLTYADDLKASELAFDQLLADGQPFDIEKRYLKPDGSVVWVSTTVSLIHKVERQRPDSVLAVVMDITERKQTQEALQDETRILELLNDSWQSLASTLDLNSLLQIVTDSGRALTDAKFGAFFYNSKNEQGDSLLLYALSGAPRSAFERFGHPRATEVFKPTFLGQPALRSDDITQDPRYGKMAPHYGMPQGHLPVKSYLAAPVISRSGEVIGALFFGHPEAAVFTARSERLIVGLAAQAAMVIDNARLYDLAQRAAEERQTLLSSERAARAEAERLSRSKDEFLAMLAHELRNPLAPVSAAVGILHQAGDDPQRVRQVREILARQIAHFTHLIDDLMDVSRVTRGLIQLETERVDVRTIISTAIEQVRPMIDAKCHSLTTRMDAEQLWVIGDRVRLVQVIANLLTNAAKYTPAQGEILLEVGVEGEHITIVISDNGNGMDSSLLPHVFDLFTQGARSLDRTQGGLGIGLALVKAIVTLHEGDVSAASAGPGEGSTFTLTLPRASHQSLPIQAQIEADMGDSMLSILLVDDNVDAAESLSMLLELIGHKVRVANTAIDALGIAEVELFDAFILDIGLPDMSGYDLAKALLRRPDLAGKPCFALTGYAQPQDRQLSAEAGFAQHFVKPVDSQLLFKALADIKV